MRDVANQRHDEKLEARKGALEAELRSRFSGQDRATMLKQPILEAYDRYYGSFKKTYHVQLQLESIVFKGKSIPTVSTLVECMFMAEMNNLLLTAGHDLDALHLPLKIDVAHGGESYTLLRGTSQSPKSGDMMITDGQGIISSIVYGPDQRTQITAHTRNVAFTVYAPGGIEAETVEKHLDELRENVMVIASDAHVELQRIFSAR